jgi:hypothetical protein
MSALRSEATCTPNLLWAGRISAPPRTGALQIALFGGLEIPKVFASGRPLLAHVDPSTFTRDANREVYFSGQKRISKIKKSVAFIFQSWYKRANPGNFRGKKSLKKIKKSVAFIFPS